MNYSEANLAVSTCLAFHIFITDRLSDTWVTVSDEEDVVPDDNNTCNEIINGRQDVVKVTCDHNSRNPPLRGRYVMIRRKHSAGLNERRYMNFCEVQVLSCHPGRWGHKMDNTLDCSQSCSGCNNTVKTCRVSDGYCYTGCKNGFWGNGCDQQCACEGEDSCDRLTGCHEKGSFKSLSP